LICRSDVIAERKVRFGQSIGFEKTAIGIASNQIIKATTHSSVCDDLIAQSNGTIHCAQRGISIASSMDRHIAIIKEASEQALVDIDAFDLVHVHFDGLAVEEAVDVNHATIRDSDLHRPTLPPSADRDDEGNGQASNC
jgi:hypothetical protein